MLLKINNSRYRPSYKYFLRFRGNIKNSIKITKFKKEKWQTFLFHLAQRETKPNLFYKVFDQEVYLVSKFTSLFRRRFKHNLYNKRALSLLYSGLSSKSLKLKIGNATKKASFSSNNRTIVAYLIESLERRLDIIIFRSYFVLSVRSAQQLISHGFVYINGSRVTKKSYLVERGDIITFSRNIHFILVDSVIRSKLWPIPPKYIQINYRIFEIAVVDNVLSTNTFLNFDSFLNLNSVIKKYKY